MTPPGRRSTWGWGSTPMRRSSMTTRSRSALVRRRALGALLLLAALPGLAAGRVAAHSAPARPAAELYLADGPTTAGLVPLDAVTLEPRPDRPRVSLGG